MPTIRTFLLWTAIGLSILSILSTFRRRRRIAPEIAQGRRLIGFGVLCTGLSMLDRSTPTASAIFIFASLAFVLRGAWLVRRARMNGLE
jgi:hypothetical protein